MSAELYGIRVLKRGDTFVDLAINVSYPRERLYTDCTFAFRILWEALRKGSASPPLARALRHENPFDDSFINQSARGFVASAELLPGATREHGTLRIYPTHPAWIAHLEEGFSWSSTAYSTGPGRPWSGPTRHPGDRVLALSDDSEAGMHIREALRSQEDTDALGKAAYAVPAHSPERYGTREALSGEALTVSAVRALLGEPVKISGMRYTGDAVGVLVKVTGEGFLSLYEETPEGGYRNRLGRLSQLERIGRAWLLCDVPVD